MSIVRYIVAGIQSGNVDAVRITHELLGQFTVGKLTDEQATIIAEIVRVQVAKEKMLDKHAG